MTYEEFALEWENNDNIKCRTSGSTGIPKLISLPKCQMLKSAERTAEYFNLDSASLLYSCISPDYIGGKMMLVRQRLLGCRLDWEKPSNTPLSGYKADKISLLSVVPSQMIYILDNIKDMPAIDNILIGGSAIPANLRKRIAESGLNAYESYGMTETASHVALRKIEETPGYFTTLGDISVESNNGRLVIRIPGWQAIETNDCTEVISSYKFRILGRSDNVIISGGIKINPERVEEELSSSISTPFFITSVPDDKWGEMVVLVAEAEETMREDLENACKCLKNGYERPKKIIIKSALNYTQNGKLIRTI